MGRTKKVTFAEKVVGATDQALPRIEAARDALLAELAPHAAGAGRKARKQLTAATALASASVDVARHALTPAPPVPEPRGRKRLVLLLALTAIAAIVFKKLRPAAVPAQEPATPYRAPVVPPPAATEPVVSDTAPATAQTNGAAETAAPEDDAEATQQLAVDAEVPTELVVEKPSADAPDQEPSGAPAESLTSFFDQVVTETEAAKKEPKR